jgi:hypothetical protein
MSIGHKFFFATLLCVELVLGVSAFKLWGLATERHTRSEAAYQRSLGRACAMDPQFHLCGDLK